MRHSACQCDDSRMDPDPRDVWPDLSGWEEVGMNEAVFRVRTAAGDEAYVRPDDGSAPLLRRLSATGRLPVPRVLDEPGRWLLVSALPGASLHEDVWLGRPAEAASIAADALRRLEAATRAIHEVHAQVAAHHAVETAPLAVRSVPHPERQDALHQFALETDLGPAKNSVIAADQQVVREVWTASAWRSRRRVRRP